MADKSPAGLSAVDFDAATAAAASAAAAEATARITSILAADGIKGDAARMTAAMDLAVRAPAMPASDVIGFITANIPAPSADGAGMAETPEAHAARRAAAGGLASPTAPVDRKTT